jgi:hypothetical protein
MRSRYARTLPRALRGGAVCEVSRRRLPGEDDGSIAGFEVRQRVSSPISPLNFGLTQRCVVAHAPLGSECDAHLPSPRIGARKRPTPSRESRPLPETGV